MRCSTRRFRQLAARFGTESFNSVLVRLREALAEPAQVQVTATVAGGPGHGAVAVTGLFSGGIPQGAPAACAIVPVPGVAGFGGLADGEYHLLAMSFHPSVTVTEALSAHETDRRFVGASPTPVEIRDSRLMPGTPVHVTLRPRRPIDPPLVLAAPLILAAESLTDEAP